MTETSIKLVILESPYAGQIEQNLSYARRAALDCAHRGEAIAASHLLYTQFLDDGQPEHRELGIKLGLAWRRVVDYSVFYTDRGWSHGMRAALASAQAEGHRFLFRSLEGNIRLPIGLLARDFPPEVYDLSQCPGGHQS